MKDSVVLFQIKQGTIHYLEKKGMESRNQSVIDIIFQTHKSNPLADNTFMIYTGDELEPQFYQYPFILSFYKKKNETHHLFPSFTFQHWKELNNGHYYQIYGGTLQGKRAIVQGFGNVASAAAYYLAQSGALIVGIIDRAGGVINEQGLTFEQVKNLFLNKNGNALAGDNLLSFDEVNQRIWALKADVFAPCAASRLITQEQIQSLIYSGLEVVSSGANVPFADREIFFGPIMESADKQISLIPDFISNCGMARVFAYFMEKRVAMTDDAIFDDVSQTIKKALQRVYEQNPDPRNISATAFEIALKQLI